MDFVLCEMKPTSAIPAATAEQEQEQHTKEKQPYTDTL